MTYAELIQLYFERSNAIQSLWTLYVVIIGGLLAVASMRQRPDFVLTVLAIVLFGAFANRNLGGIHDITVQRFAVLDQIHAVSAAELSNKQTAFERTLTPPEFGGVRNFHVGCAALTILSLCAMEARRRRPAAQLP